VKTGIEAVLLVSLVLGYVLTGCETYEPVIEETYDTESGLRFTSYQLAGSDDTVETIKIQFGFVHNGALLGTTFTTLITHPEKVELDLIRFVCGAAVHEFPLSSPRITHASPGRVSSEYTRQIPNSLPHEIAGSSRTTIVLEGRLVTIEIDLYEPELTRLHRFLDEHPGPGNSPYKVSGE
jgi:hypothetical protein